MTASSNPQENAPLATPFRKWCQQVGISASNGYSKVRAGKIRLVKIGKRSVITADESARILREGI